MWLLIGGSGFIGVNFAKFLMKNDYDFMIYDNNRSKYLPENVKTIIGDVRDKTKLSKAMKGCEVVFHLATVPPSVKLSKREIYDIEVNGTQNVLSTVIENNVGKIVFTSSASHVYGLVDENLCPIQEDCKLNPINDYGKNKVIAEELCKKASETKGLQTVVLRLSMVLGPYDFDPVLIENMLALFKNKRVVIAGNGESKNQSIHVEDVNTALLASAETSDNMLSDHSIFNIAGKEVLSINEFIQLSRCMIGSTSKVVHLPLFLTKVMVNMAWCLHKTKIHPSYLDLMVQDQYFDISKAKRILKWKPNYTVENALNDTIEFLRKEYL